MDRVSGTKEAREGKLESDHGSSVMATLPPDHCRLLVRNPEEAGKRVC